MSSSMKRFLGSMKDRLKSKPTTRKGRTNRYPSIDQLEMRELMAVGGEFSVATGILTIWGTSSSDSATIGYATQVKDGKSIQDTSKVALSLMNDTGYQIDQTFSTTGLKHIVFAGKAGNDYFKNSTLLPASIAPTTGRVSTSLLDGVPGNNMLSQAPTGVYTVGTTGAVSVDYIFCGAGYRGQLAIYSLEGMGSFTPGSAAYNKEAARRSLSGSTLGNIVISAKTEAAKFSASLPWEGNMNTGHGTYLGPRTVKMTPGGTFAFMLIPNGTVSELFANPSAGGSLTPLYSIPQANPYKVTSQLLAAQSADLDGHGSLFSFEDLRLDGSSDRDYNDMIYQVTGARGNQPYVKDVQSATRDITSTPIFADIAKYAAIQEAKDAAATIGTWSSGVATVLTTGEVGIDYLFDGGGYLGEVGIFSLQGMANLKPGSPEFVKEAARRSLSRSMLGQVVISDASEGARTSSALSWETDFNAGKYQGIKTIKMTPGDSIGIMLVPAGTVWEAYNNPSPKEVKKQPIFSMPEANPKSGLYGRDQFASLSKDGKTFGFEDIAVAAGNSDRDFNDIVLRFIGVTMTAPELNAVANSSKNFLKAPQAPKILA